MSANAQFLFKQAASFGPGLSFSKGIHHVGDGVQKHAYFQKMVKAGLIVEAKNGAAGASVPASQIENQKKAIDSAKAQASQKLAKAADEDAKVDPKAGKAPSKSKK
jgi:hypothetical protein